MAASDMEIASMSVKPDRRVAVVTGAAGGMGRAMALALARSGVATVGVDRQFQGEWMPSADVSGEQVFWHAPLDVTDREQCRAVIAQTVERLGRLDILVNCAGVSMAPACPPGKLRIPFQHSNLEGYLRIFEINLLGTIAVTRHAVDAMVSSGGGKIVNVTTSFDTMLVHDLSGYGASKAALEALTSSWSKDLAAVGITCNSLVPGGPTDTGFFPPDLPRPAHLYPPEVMADPVLWLASKASDGVTGRRIIATQWDRSRQQYAAEDFSEVGWPDLARAAQGSRGYDV
jgi:3-oxoacyl-[acyl-carrier protein] reductase